MADTQIVKVVDQKKYSVSYLIGALIAGLVIGTLLSFVWFKTGDSKPTKVEDAGDTVSMGTTTTKTDTTPEVSEVKDSTDSTKDTKGTSTDITPVANAGAMLSISDQPAGLSVAVTAAQVSSDQWVVIRESKNGVQGNVLGAARFVGGATSGTVELLRTTVTGSTYYGVIYKDNGDRVFSLTDDTPLTDASGNPVLVSFTAK